MKKLCEAALWSKMKVGNRCREQDYLTVKRNSATTDEVIQIGSYSPEKKDITQKMNRV